MQIENQKVSRRKLVGWLGILSVFTMAGAAFRPSKKRAPKTVKMLTQDGLLVEIDASLLAVNKRKISVKELQNWVKNKNSNNSIFKI
jgi:hypothetical protein